MTGVQEERHRRVRSFVLRTGRMTAGQKAAYQMLWPRYGLSIHDGILEPDGIFGRSQPLILEIGFGMGHSLIEMAANAPTNNYIGVEVHRPGVGKLLQMMEQTGVDNIRVFEHDVVDVLQSCISDSSLSGVQIFFPDPWHKKKHHKRRLITPEFTSLLATKIHAGGFLHLATDWENYAQQMLEVLRSSDCFDNAAEEGEFIARPASRPLTKFERRAQRLNYSTWDLYFIRR